MFCFTLCYGCSKKEERETLAEVQTIEEDSEEPQKEQKEKQNEEGGAEGGKICVYVCGQVVEPGVYELKNTSRLYEACLLYTSSCADESGDSGDRICVS